MSLKSYFSKHKKEFKASVFLITFSIAIVMLCYFVSSSLPLPFHLRNIIVICSPFASIPFIFVVWQQLMKRVYG